MNRFVRLAAVSYAPPVRDHSKGVDLSALRKIVLDVARDKPNFICFPEICACSGPIAKAKTYAPEIGPFAEAAGTFHFQEQKIFNVSYALETSLQKEERVPHVI